MVCIDPRVVNDSSVQVKVGTSIDMTHLPCLCPLLVGTLHLLLKFIYSFIFFANKYATSLKI
jgi:hypothetical protein